MVGLAGWAGVKEAGGTRVAGDMLPGRARAHAMPCHAGGLMQMQETGAMTGGPAWWLVRVLS